jgi:trk system potassium uptake protein TrkA
MKVIVVGCGRVGSAVALELQRAGWDVAVIDEREEALGRLGDDWTGEFFVGHGMDIQLLKDAGIELADAVVVSTNGDNTNIIVGQVAQKQFDVRCVIVRVLDPARAEFYASRGLRTVSPTSAAIASLTEGVRAFEATPRAAV